MDLDTKQTKLILSQTKRKTLTLEARHSISIEASNKIRSKLSPRLFIPKLKSKSQYFSKELKPKNEYLKNLKKLTDISQEYKTFKKCQIEHLSNCWKGKYTKKLQSVKSFNKMENSKNNLFQSKYQNIKILRKNMKRTPKDLKLSVGMDKQNIEKATDTKFEQNDVTPSNTPTVTNAKDNAIKKWANLKVIANENLTDSASYLTDGEIIFIDDSEELYSLCKEENTSDVQANATAIFKKPAVKNSMENIHKNNGNSTNLHGNENGTEATPRQEAENSKQSNFSNSKKTIKNKLVLGGDLKAKAKENYKKIVTKNVAVLIRRKSPNILQSSLISTRQNEDCTTTLNNKIIEKEQIQSNSTEITREEARNFTQINIKQTKEGKEQERIQEQPVLDIQKSVESIYKSSVNLLNKEETANQQSTLSVSNNTKSSKVNKMNTKYNYAPVKSPLDSYLNTVKSAVEDFQDAVRSSISLIYDCSPNDRKISEDLNELENCVDNFSKYVLQSYHDVEAKELETKNCMEYIRKLGVDGREPSRPPHTTSLNQTKYAEETTESITILIEADNLPTKTITFKTRDIFCQKVNQYEYIDGSSAIPKASLQSNSDNATNNEMIFNSNSIPAHTQLDVMSSQTSKNYKRLTRRRRKVTPKILNNSNNIPALNSQYPLLTSAVGGQDSSNNSNNISSQRRNTISYTNPVNLIYTQAPNNYNSFPALKPLNLSTNTKRSTNSLNSPLRTESPASATTNCYNYSPAVDNANNGNSKLKLSEDQRQYFGQQRNQTSNYNPNRFEPPNALCRVSYLQKHYIQQFNESNAYNSQSVNNFSTLAVTNLPAVEDLQMGNK